MPDQQPVLQLRVSYPDAFSKLTRLIEEGRNTFQELWDDYAHKWDNSTWKSETDNARLTEKANAWCAKIAPTLNEVFPTALEVREVKQYGRTAELCRRGQQDPAAMRCLNGLDTILEKLSQILDKRLPMYAAAEAEECASPTGEKNDLGPARHSGDFRSVHWYGEYYFFTANQARVVRILWEAWKHGTPEVGDAYLLTEADVSGDRLANLFRGNRAWGTMIVDGSTRGTSRLQPPPTS